MTRLYLVRHGETIWNVQGRYQGQLNPPLNERGREQAEATARALATEGIEAIWSSDLARARQTAQALARRTGLPVHQDCRLREICQGEWQGILIGDIRSRWPDELARWQNEPWDCSPPGGETLAQVLVRLLAAIQDIAIAHPDSRVAVYTHKLPIALLKIQYKGAAASDLWHHLPANGAWERIEVAAASAGSR